MADLIRPDSTADNPVEAAMTDSVRPVCDCPEPCACYAEGYAAGKDKAYFEVLANLEGCACEVKRACLQKVMTLLARSSPALFEAVEAWAWRTKTTGAEIETGPRGTPALLPTHPEGAPTSPVGVNVLADAGRRAAAGPPTPDGPTSPAKRISPYGVSRTGAPACRQVRPTSAVTWST